MKYIKKIWLDLRFLKKDNYYSQFIYELIWTFIKQTPEYFYNIYIDLSFSNLNFWENTKNIFPLAKYKSIREQTHLTKKIYKDRNDLVIFFSYNKPLNFKGNYISFIPELSNFHFPLKQNILIRYFNNIIFNNTCKNAKQIICFDKKTQSEINDKLNISEEKISILKPFFSKIILNKNENLKNLTLNLETKYNIKWNYFIYNSGIWTEKNLNKILKVFKKIKENNLNLNLIILDNETIRDLDFRKQVINENMTDKIFFIWNIWEYEKDYFYKNSNWIILPHLYNVFPFSLSKALNYNINIFSSDLKNLKNILWEKIKYFNPNNLEDIYNKLIQINRQNNNYLEIFDNNNISNSIEDLKKIIKEV